MTDEEFEKAWALAEKGAEETAREYEEWFSKLSKEEQEREKYIEENTRLWEDLSDSYL